MTGNKNDKLTVNISEKANLIIGQSFILTVTLKTKKPINKSNTNLIFTGASPNIVVPSAPLPLKLDENNNTLATYTTILTVSDNPSVIRENDSIKFIIKANGSDADSFELKGTARKINPSSLSLMLDRVFLDTPNQNIDPTNKGTSVTTVLLDNLGKTLGNTPIFIVSQIPANLLDCLILKDDKRTPILPQQMGSGFIGLPINSDPDGNIKFYIVPQKSNSMVLELQSLIPNVGFPVPATSPLFIVNTEIPSFIDTIPGPNIMGGFPGPLISDGGEPNFYVGVFDYPNANSGDYILFFTQQINQNNAVRNYSGHYVTVGNPNTELGSEKYFYSLPYDIFEIGTPYVFNYVVLLGKGAASLTSIPEPVTYMGGATYSPDTTVKRDYDPCMVYSSLGVLNRRPMAQGSTIGYDSIKKYLDNPNIGTLTPVTGLFIEVVGGNDSTVKVPLGAKVTLNMYIQAANRNIHQPVGTQIIKPTKDPKTNRYSAIFHIKMKDLVNITGGAGSIWFDYEFGTESNKGYGKIWAGGIDTRSENISGNNN
ncbi:hypothetical protein L7750_03250 [Xenorhabdus bovienii]|uniref:Uncharacterized protein n=1 Tax=Xenorhabdus bovienii str. kraussei Becker Underwood TaxID=1398204 RepID=A0A077PND5_XENBV|nr:hypothetical protein [Xenorhabdus bovienii]MCG3469447.1 hypothetical protein [Xenorhabdus bovienii]CDH22588.1 conserved hypothetical protein [Xenorhabdus bovienii str. kraussei Becker Underwood]